MSNLPGEEPVAGGGSTSDTCPLAWPDQRRNLILFAACTGMQYLAAPILYVGVTQASLCQSLGATVSTSNLPGILYFAMTATPALIAWLAPEVSVLKRNLSLCYVSAAMILALISMTLAWSTSNELKIAMVILQGGVTGAVVPTAIALLWEAIRRGVDESRRGLALGLGFGLGPVMAVFGSVAHSGLFKGNILGISLPYLDDSTKWVILFGAGVPILLFTALLGQFLIIPPVEHEPQREPVSCVIGLLIGLPAMFASVGLIQAASAFSIDVLQYLGYVAAVIAAIALILHFRPVLSQPVLRTATIVTILVYAGNVIPSNMNLYSEEVLGKLPMNIAGDQNTWRFACKVVAGALLGWLLTRTNPRTAVVATASIFLACQVWAILVTGPWYVVAFGIHGAGELVGVYAPNYIVSASRRDDLRRNAAFMTMLMVPAAPAGYFYASIVDWVKSHGWTLFGMSSSALGFRLSFLVCAMTILCGIVLALLRLPANPRPEQSSENPALSDCIRQDNES